MRTTFHLVPNDVWLASDPGAPFTAPSLADEGFVHTTDGEAELIVTANRYYSDDPRPYLALTFDLDATGSPWRTDDDRGVYPHIFGPIDRSAILDHRPVTRDADGTFTGLGPSSPDPTPSHPTG